MRKNGKPSVGSRACLACRKVKMRCLVDDRETVCERCARKSIDCVFLEHRRGRKPGTRIVRKPATTTTTTTTTPMTTPPMATTAATTASSKTPSPSPRDDYGAGEHAAMLLLPRPPGSGRTRAPRPPSQGGGFDSRDLQPPSLLHHAATQGRFSLHTVLNPAGDEASPHPSRVPRIPGQDPVQLGYVNSTIATSLFDHFINVLNPYICQLDPLLHTMDYVRQRSAFLFTTVLAVAAKTFGSSTYRTLYDHAEALMAESFRRGEKSVEIAQAIMMTTYWKEPADTRAWLSLGYVIRMGMDLGWHLLKPVPPPPPVTRAAAAANQQAGDTTTATATAAAPDNGGQDDVKERELRNIQRTWYVLFVYDHSMSLQTGKPWMIERNEFIQSVEDWCQHPMAMAADQLLGAFVTLRLLGTEAFQLMRAAAGRLRSSSSSSSSEQALNNSEPLLNMLEAQLDRWEQRWVPRMAGDGRHGFMVRFYGMHLRLQLFSLFLPRVLATARDGGAPPHLRILWTCYASALEMLELICQSAEWLFFAQDSIHVMTAYSAAFLVKLLLSVPEAIAVQIESKIVQTIKATSLVFSLQATPPTSSRALQARFLDQILSGLANPGREKDAPAPDPGLLDQFGHAAGTPPSFAAAGDLQGGGPAAGASADLGPGQQTAQTAQTAQTVQTAQTAQTALDWLLEQHDATNNLFAFAGFDLEEGVFFT